MAEAMAWKETCRVEERFRFIGEFGGEVEPSLASVCRRYGVSRRTGYKWLRRYEEGGLEGLRDRPPRAIIQAQQLPLELEDLIVRSCGERTRTGGRRSSPSC
jgi:putative transposase